MKSRPAAVGASVACGDRFSGQVMEVIRAAEMLSQAPPPPNAAPGPPALPTAPKTTTVVMGKHTLAGAVSHCW